MLRNREKFSQRHPFIFGLFLIIVAMVLIFSTMAFFYSIKDKLSFGPFTSPKIGVVNIHGTINDSKPIIQWIHKLKKNKKIVGVLLRIDSPGGVVAPSQEIYEAVKDLNKIKPVVVSMGSVAASGAYYISCGARYIVANPGTITGSIGVVANLITVEDLMKKWGIEDESIASGEFKTAGSPFKKLSPVQKTYLKNLVTDLYNQFIEAVAIGRKLNIEKVRKIADGKAYTGRQAKKLGLVDYLGNMDKAIDVLKKLCGIKGDIELIEGPEEKKSIVKKIFGALNEKEKLPVRIGFYYIYPLYN